MKISTWSDLLNSIYTDGQILHGSDLSEWLSLIQSEYDEVDAIYLEAESIGGE